MTGTVTQVMGLKQTFCLILTPDGTEVFAHKLDFVNPQTMKAGASVKFRLKLATTGKRPAATDVELIAA